MNISYNWLRELVDVSLSPRELAERLTMVGLAVDAVDEAGGDSVIEIDLTSNRPDCLSHLGVAREAAAIEGKGVRLPATEAARREGKAADFAAVEIVDAELCPRYAARVVRGVKIAPSPAWLVERLQAIGQRPINNVADITNFVLHELGQPLHAFDLSTLAERKIVVRRARAGEKMKTLDGVERTLDGEMLVIADAARAVALAGVMGGEETEIKDSTTDVLIESAYFKPESVRRTSKQLGLQTDASYRFERGTDYEGVRLAQDRCVALICEIAGGVASEDAVDVYPRKVARGEVSLRPERVETVTGLKVSVEEVEGILAALGFEKTGGDSESMIFSVPSWRGDVSIEEDLVEEVARHYGYDKMTDALPASAVAGEYRKGERRTRAAKLALTSLGFDEAINFSFIDAGNAGRFEPLPSLQTPENDVDAGSVTLSNPIIEGASLMRPTLLPGLLESIQHNFNHGTRNVRLFETGHVFAAQATGERPIERDALALALTGGAVEEGTAAAARELDFYDLKGALEAALDASNVRGIEFEASSLAHLREGQAARVLSGGATVGFIGRLADSVCASYKFRQPVYVAEVDYGALLETEETPARYTPLARFPSVVRDVSLVADRSVTFAEMRRAILSLGIPECRGVALVDVYEGANLPEGSRSITLRIEYRSGERTLRDEEADLMHARVVRTLETAFGAQLRG